MQLPAGSNHQFSNDVIMWAFRHRLREDVVAMGTWECLVELLKSPLIDSLLHRVLDVHHPRGSQSFE